MSSIMDTRAEPSPAALPIDYNKRLMLFSGRANPQLAVDIADKLGVELGPVTLKTFSNGEVYCRYKESIRGADVFIVQSTAANEIEGMTPNDALMELLAMIDAAQGASAHRIIAVMPWYGYARQDKKSQPREPITARVVAKCLEAVGVDRVLTMDLHSGQVQGFFEVPVDHMTAMTRCALAPTAASMRNSSSMSASLALRPRSGFAHVGWMMKTSAPRIDSS